MGYQNFFKRASKTPSASEWIGAAFSRDIEILKTLLERGADINQSDPNVSFVTALSIAATFDDVRMARFLVDNGAEIHERELGIAKAHNNSRTLKMLEDAMARRQSAQEASLPVNEERGDELAIAVQGGDCQQARAVFDKVFWDGQRILPEWKHLKIALLREDKPMMRLLVTWGAKAPESAEQLSGIPADKYASYAKILRAYGLDATVVETAAKAAPAAVEGIGISFEDARKEPISVNNMWEWSQVLKEGVTHAIPEEWKKVLESLRAVGADEAVIAGGALRDTFNGKPVKDVDIFLKTRGSEKKNRQFLETAFNASGIEVFGQDMNDDNYCPTFETFPKPSAQTEGGWLNRKKIMESWKVIAGPNKTEYNIIFVDGDLAARSSQDFGAYLVQGFDMGFCQILYDGRNTLARPYFMRDVASQRITIVTQNPSSEDHLNRLRKKYPDWQVCREDGHLFEDVYSAPDKGIYVGTKEIRDAKGKSLGLFDIYAAPEDLREVGVGARLFASFERTVMDVLAGAHWYGHAGICIKNDSELHKAIQKGKYQGEWFIPTFDILKSLYANRGRGALKDTFNNSSCYWSCTDLEGHSKYARYLYFGDGQYNHQARKDYYPAACRPVRMEPADKVVLKKTGTGSTGPK